MAKLAGPKGHPLLGHLAAFRADRLSFFTDCARTYGDIVPLRLPGKPLFLLSHPDLIEQVLVTQSKHFVKHFGLRLYMPVLGNGLVTSEGDFWRKQRKRSAPAFQGARLSGYADMMVAATSAMLATWPATAAAAPVRRDVHDDLMRLTLDIACQTLFGAGACPNPQVVGQAMHDALQAIEVRFGRLFPIPDWFPTPANLKLRRSVRSLNNVVGGIINRRRQEIAGGNGNGEDLLSGLLRSTAEQGTAMSDAQLLDEVRTIFLAGHETTALALTYSLYLLATNPATQEKLQQELQSALAGKPPTYQDLPRLPYTRRVILESMRLYPPADVLGREAINDCTIGPLKIRRGTTIFMSQWVMHRDPRYFDNPQVFQPDRWTETFERSLPRSVYFPFGGGPRNCIGQSFAMAEAALVLATICQGYTFTPDPSFQLKLWPSITLRPADGVHLLVARREAEDHPKRGADASAQADQPESSHS